MCRRLAGRIVFGVVALLVLTLSGCGSDMLGQSADTFKAALGENEIVAEGIASNDYLDPSPYAVTAFDLGEVTKDGDAALSAEATATIENANYKTDLTLRAVYRRAGEGEAMTETYLFDVLDSETTPKKGIDHDEAHDLSGCDATLLEGGKTCTVETENASNMWFANSTTKTTYSYSFDGKAWSFEGKDKESEVTYKDFGGTYAIDGSPELRQFEITDVDTATGEFTVSYSIDLTGKSSAGNWTYPVVSGKASATLQQVGGDRYTAEDGNAYTFSVTCDNETGGGTATFEGHLFSDDGKEALRISECSVVYYFTFGASGREVDSAYNFNGTMYRQ